MIDATANRPATVSEFEVWGMRLGIQCAKTILSAPTMCKPHWSDVVVAEYAKIVAYFVAEQRAANGLNDCGELSYRYGFTRGLRSQLRHPKARIEIEVVR